MARNPGSVLSLSKVMSDVAGPAELVMHRIPHGTPTQGVWLWDRGVMP